MNRVDLRMLRVNEWQTMILNCRWIERDFDEASKSIVALIEKVTVAISLIRLSQVIQQLCRLSREPLYIQGRPF